jgi:two-component system chemotaxis sensor kinase CheA
VNGNVPARLIRVFMSELDERLNEFDADLVALEGTSSEAERTDTVTRLFRGAHSLKGAAASVGASGIEIVCQQLEDTLAKVRDGALELDAARCAKLFAAADELREAGRALAGTADPAPAPEPPPAPAPSPTPGAEAALRRRMPSRVHVRDTTLRVPAERIDLLLEQSGELLVAHPRAGELVHDVLEASSTVGRLRQRARNAGKPQRDELTALHASLERIAEALNAERTFLQRASSELNDGIRAIRMVPFGMVCEGLDRVAADAAAATGKRVHLEIAAAEVGIDRVMVDRLRDPLVQLVRNAVDHGIESPAERVQRGKPAQGTIRLSVRPLPRLVEVTLSDDGRGLDLEALRARVTARGVDLDDADLTQAIFLPGISTAAAVTNLSGRGVGLDVVRSEIESMSGSVEVRTVSGGGTTFVLTFPLTVTTFRVMLVAVGAQTYGLNLSSIERVIRIDAANVASVEGRSMLLLDDSVIPLVPLRTVLGTEDTGDVEPQIALILKRGEHTVAVAVDALIEEREIYLRSLGPRLAGLPNISGATIASDGSVTLIVRTSTLVESALAVARNTRHLPLASPASAEIAKRVLLVDDSITTRTLERSILEAAGFEVLTAPDGQAAWTLLAEQSVDLVVSDVDMPRMTGLELVEAIRGSATLRELPVILVTARENETDRQRGLEIGADAYIVKSGFRQEELLDAIGALT